MLQVDHSSAYGSRLITTQAFVKGQLIYKINDYRLTDKPTYRSIQIASGQHIEDIGIIVYLNHSCDPSTIVDTTTLTIRAARNLAAGEELTFFYPSTEWDMDRPFVCLCGSPGCVRLVAGARYLSVETLARYYINQHVRAAISEMLENTVTIHSPVRPLPLDTTLFQPEYVERQNDKNL